MYAPLVEFDFKVGVPEVDEAHRQIQQEAVRFQHLLDAAAPRADIIACFTHLRALIVGHFELEEKIFVRLEAGEAGADHVRRHRENHRVMTDSFTYAFDKLASAGADGPLPNIMPLIPRKYLGEMLSLDRELAGLIAEDITQS